MAKKINVDPLTRIEGHLAIHCDIESGRVVQAYCAGEMFRGFETILRGRDPLDAQQIVQRICGVCPISHGTASIFAQDEAFGAKVPPNGRLLRNLILAANYVQSHLIHFYQLAAPDFIDIAAVKSYNGTDPALRQLRAWIESQLATNLVYPVAPFLPRYNGDYATKNELNFIAAKHYVEALEMRKIAHEAVAIFAGKVPHAPTLVPGGVTEQALPLKLEAYRSRMLKLLQFIDSAYLPDVKEVALAFPAYFQLGKGPENFLCYGGFPENEAKSEFFLPRGIVTEGSLRTFDASRISESTHTSFFSTPDGLHPSKGETAPRPEKNGAYSWVKAPRYDGRPYEVGPLARTMIAYQAGDKRVKPAVDSALGALGKTFTDLNSVAGRHLVRALECKLVAERALEWLDQVKPGEAAFTDFNIPQSGSGMGLVEAPRGALGHWLTVGGAKIERYQCVVPTTWNCSPRDEKGVAGPVEQTLVGTPVADESSPIEVARVVRAFDPCLACAVH